MIYLKVVGIVLLLCCWWFAVLWMVSDLLRSAS